MLLGQYFLPFASEGINKKIEKAILRADKLGVKVISLAALNKVGIFFISFLVFLFLYVYMITLLLYIQDKCYTGLGINVNTLMQIYLILKLCT